MTKLSFFFNFTILYWFCHISKWILHRYTRVPHTERSSFLPPHIIPLGHPSAPAPSIRYRTWTGVSHGVQKTVLYICVSFAISHTGLSLPSLKIPYICISILYWCFSFWLTSLCIIGSSFSHLIRTDSNVFFFFNGNF